MDRVSFIEAFQRLIEAIIPDTGVAPIDQGDVILRLLQDGSVEAGESFIKPLKIKKDHATIDHDVGTLRRDGERRVETRQSFFVPAELAEGNTSAVASIGVCVVQRESPVAHSQRLVEAV